MSGIFRLVKTLAVQNLLGECPAWQPESGTLWWTDIEGRKLFRYTLADAKLERNRTPQRLCSFAFTPKENRLLAAFESGIALYALADGKTEWLYRLAGGGTLRFNDGRPDRAGRFWAGTMTEAPVPDREPPGRLFCFDRKGLAYRHGEKIGITNTIAFSPDGRKLYFSDSSRHTIFVCDLSGGTPTDQRIFAHTGDGAVPDGAAVDSDGCLWCALWGAGRIVRYAPDGRVLATYETPASQPSSVAFGGQNMKYLFVTSARCGLPPEELARQPEAGNLFIFETNVMGMADAAFT